MADRRLQIFHAVARHQSFTRAAEALFMTQPSITFQIKQLEAEYGARLFERRRGGVSLTPAGEVMLPYAERILAITSELETRLGEMTGEMRGTLLVGAGSSIAGFMLPPVLGEFNDLYPQVRVQLSVANSAEIEHRVAGHSLDVGFISVVPTLPGLASRRAGSDELVAICAPDYPLASLAAVTPKLLVDYEFITREPGSGIRTLFETWFAADKIAPERLKTQMELGSPEALKGLVATGLGFAIVPRVTVVKELRLGELAAVPLTPPLQREARLIYPEERFQSRLVATFAQFAAGKLKELYS
ncbi:MAG: LysR family transcriptional regulator [Azonexus sp.]|jgi:DNA-binding transcriptional LysR family regulator|nr:LysR family transcriptional regulator [Azonexus sp.]